VIRDRFWPYAITALAAATAALVALDVETVVRAPIAVAFVVVCPGMALVRVFHLEPWAELLLAVVLSLCLAAGLATISVYLGSWNPTEVLLAIVAITMAGVIADVARGRRWEA
jgi:hypothetical protein